MKIFSNRARLGLLLAFTVSVVIAGGANDTVEVNSSAQTEILTIIAEDSQSPWSYPDGTGYANDVVRAAYAAVGVRVQLIVQPYARCKQNVLNGLAAGCFSMSSAPELEGKVIFSEAPLFICHADYMHRVDMPLEATSEETIRRKIVVGSVIGYEYPPSLARLRDNGLVVLEEANSELLNLKNWTRDGSMPRSSTTTRSRRISTCAPRLVCDVIIRPAFRSGELKSYIGFSTRHLRGHWARERFDAGFAIIRKNGVLLALTEKWKGILQTEFRTLRPIR